MRAFKIVVIPLTAAGRAMGEWCSPSTRYADSIVAEVRRRYAEGVGSRRISKAMKIPRPTVRSWIGRGGAYPRRFAKAAKVVVKRVPIDA
jgi:hypothetical protein